MTRQMSSGPRCEGAVHKPIQQEDVIRAWARRDIAVAQAAGRDVKGALQTAAAIRDDFLDSALTGDALRAIAAIQTATGDARGALGWASIQTAPAAKSLALLGVGEGMLNRLGVGRPRQGASRGWFDPPDD